MLFEHPPYLDPGSGSFLIQLIFACGICGTPAAAIAAILAFFRRRKKKTDKDESSVEDAHSNPN